MKNIQTYLIIIVCFILGFFTGKSCRSECTTVITKVNRDTIYIQPDTIKITIEKEKIVPKYIEKITKVPVQYIDTITNNIDSSKIVKEFLTAQHYDQVLVNDSRGYVRLKQIIAMNQIQQQDFIFNPPKQMIIKETNYVRDERLRFSLGGEYNWHKDYNDFILKGGIVLKNTYQFQIGYGVNNTKSIGFNMLF